MYKYICKYVLTAPLSVTIESLLFLLQHFLGKLFVTTNIWGQLLICFAHLQTDI